MLTENKALYDFAIVHFAGYLDPADWITQKFLTDTLGIPEVNQGICQMLSINWLIQCGEGTGPATAWQRMAQNGTVYFKQIARQHQGYQSSVVPTTSKKDAAKTYLELATYSKSTVVGYIDINTPSPAEFGTAVGSGLPRSTTAGSNPPVVLVDISFAVGGHLVAAAQAGGIVYVFDPNFGVFKIDSGSKTPGTLGDLMVKLFAAYSHYGLTLDHGFIAVVHSKKN